MKDKQDDLPYLFGEGERVMVDTVEYPMFTGEYRRPVDGRLHLIELDSGVEVELLETDFIQLRRERKNGHRALDRWEDEPPPAILRPEIPADRIALRDSKALVINSPIETINYKIMLDVLAGATVEKVALRYGILPSEVDERFRASVDNALASQSQDGIRLALIQATMMEIEHISSWERNMVQRGYHRSQALDKFGDVHTLWEDASDQDTLIKYKETKLKYMKQLQVLLGLEAATTGGATGGTGGGDVDRIINAFKSTAVELGYRKGVTDGMKTVEAEHQDEE